MAVLTLLTDFGLDDYYVAAVKGTVLRLAPGTTLVDIAHTVPPGDVEQAAFLLAAAAPSFPPGTVHLAVVDPGVGSARRRLLLAARGQLFVAPDNGLLTPWLGAGRPRAVAPGEFELPAPGETFHGRDRFAPLAAALLGGASPDGLGEEIADPVRLEVPQPARDEGELRGRVVHVDRFGNLVSDLPSSWLSPQRPFVAEIAGVPPLRVERFAGCYAELPRGLPGVLPGSLGTLEFSLRGESLAAWSGRTRGAAVRVRFR